MSNPKKIVQIFALYVLFSLQNWAKNKQTMKCSLSNNNQRCKHKSNAAGARINIRFMVRKRYMLFFMTCLCLLFGFV